MRAADLFTQYREAINPPYNRKDLITVGVTLFILLVFPLTIIAALNARSLLPRAKTVGEEPVAKTGEASFLSNELLVKVKKEARGKVKEGNPADTGIASLNNINKEFKVKKFEKVAKVGKNSKADADIFDWYKVTLEGKGEKIAGKLEQVSGRISLKNPGNPALQTLQDLILKFRSDQAIQAVEPNYVVSILTDATPSSTPATPSPTPSQPATTVITTSSVPNDPYYSSSGSWGQAYPDLWGLKKINMEGAWAQTTGSTAVVVAGIDTGVDRNHEDIKDNMWVNTAETPNNGIDDDGNGYKDDYYGWDWVNNDGDPMDDHGHGTHTVGTIAAVGNNGIGVVGVNWVSKIMALKFLDSGGGGSLENGVRALQYAADMGARVSSNSWGCACNSVAMDDAVVYEHDRGMIMVAAAGNSNADAIGFSPASVDYAITVASSDHNDAKSDFSNWGEKIDVAAPGGDSSNSSSNYDYRNILSLKAAGTDMYGGGGMVVGNNYYRARGTSMATPHVAGLAALLLAKNPNLNNEEVRQILRRGADDLGTAGKDKDFGYGRINANGSVSLANIHPLTPIITSPRSRDVVVGSTTNIQGSVSGPNFQKYKVEMGIGRSPTAWTLLKESTTQVTTNGILATADTSTLAENTLVTFRLTAFDTAGKNYQFQVFDYTVDNLEALLTAPEYSVYGEVVDITGTAQAKNGGTFANYTLEYGEGSSPSSWISTGITTINGGSLPVVNGKLGTWDTSSLKNDTVYTLRLTVKGQDGGTEQTKKKVTADREVLPGWPKSFGTSAVGQPAIADLNNDGKEEIVVTEDNKIHVFAKNGSSLAGWPVTLPNTIFIPSVISDVDNNGTKEILVKSVSTYVLRYDGTTLAGWPQPLGDSVYGLSVGDLDGNGTKEIVSFERGPFAHDLKVLARNANGSVVSGFPKTIYTDATQLATSGQGDYQAALIDLENDGKMEMILRTFVENIDKVFVLDYQGNPKPGWPKTISGYAVVRALAGDITGDGKKEVIVYYYSTNISGGSMSINAYDANGNQLTNYPVEAANGVERMGPALADVTGDGVLDIVLPHYGDGTAKFGASPLVFTKDGRYASVYVFFGHGQIPAIFDFNGDGQPDVSSSPGSQGIDVTSRSFDSTGKLVWTEVWKKITNGYTGPAVISDMDKNGKWEIVVGVRELSGIVSKIFVWEPATSNSKNGTLISWPQYLKDEARSSTYPATPGDTTPPTVSITAPTAGSTVSGSVNVTATASDNVGVTRVEFYVDSILKATDTTSPYGFPWDSTTVLNGSHAIAAKAYDAASNSALDSVTVTVANGDTQPPSTPTNLTAVAVAYNKVNLSWTASTDNVGVTGYWIVRNGVTIASSATNSYSDTTVSPSTTYSYQVIAYDAAGNNSGPSNTATATTPAAPDTQAPTVPTNFTATAVSSSQINLSWTASTDNVGVTGYDVYRNNSKVATVATTSYGDTGLSPSTTYSYFVKARDAAGNVSASSNTASATTQAPPVTTGNVTGKIVDSSTGTALVGVKITISRSGFRSTATTNSSGNYSFVNLIPGTYGLKGSAKGYTAQSKSVTVVANTTLTVNFSLVKR